MQFDNLYMDDSTPLPDGIMRETDHVNDGWQDGTCLWLWRCGQGLYHCSQTFRAGALVVVTEVDPIFALQALYGALEGIPVLTFDDVVSEADITSLIHLMKKMKNNAIDSNISHF